MSPKLSIAMIVKNEAQHLPECLATLAPLAAEICVVDTGSTDNTVEIAQAAGAVVRHFVWCDDFAAARNASLRACSGDWIFVLDADERIAPEDHDALRQFLDGPREVAYRVTTRNYTDHTQQSGYMACAPAAPHARGFAGWFPSTKVRLFPRRDDVAFEGAVHELINPSLERAGVSLRDAPFPVHHYALTKDATTLREKQALYLRLGETKLRAEPSNPKAHAELANQYVDLGDYPRAAQHLREALRLAPQSTELLKDLGGVLHLLGRHAEAEKALRLAVTLDPAHVEAWRNLGVVLAAREAWPEAHAALTHALSLAPGDPVLTEYAVFTKSRLSTP